MKLSIFPLFARISQMAIKAIHEIDFEIKNRTPLNCRQSPKFSKYFDMMWSELNEKETKEKNNKI